MDIKYFQLHYNRPWALRHALIILPYADIVQGMEVEQVQYLERANLMIVREELLEYAHTLRNLGVLVTLLDCEDPSLRNIHFASDNTFSWHNIIYLPRMHNDSRVKEVDWLHNNLPLPTVRKDYKWPVDWESSDILTTPEGALIGVGNRTEYGIEGYIRELTSLVTRVVSVPLGLQHLMGVVRPMSRSVAGVRVDQVSKGALNTIMEFFPRVIPFYDTIEVTERLGFNFVPVGGKEKTIIIPNDVPNIKKLLQNYRYNPIEVSISELRKTDGGLACATGRLA